MTILLMFSLTHRDWNNQKQHILYVNFNYRLRASARASAYTHVHMHSMCFDVTISMCHVILLLCSLFCIFEFIVAGEWNNLIAFFIFMLFFYSFRSPFHIEEWNNKLMRVKSGEKCNKSMVRSWFQRHINSLCPYAHRVAYCIYTIASCIAHKHKHRHIHRRTHGSAAHNKIKLRNAFIIVPWFYKNFGWKIELYLRCVRIHARTRLREWIYAKKQQQQRHWGPFLFEQQKKWKEKGYFALVLVRIHVQRSFVFELVFDSVSLHVLSNKQIFGLKTVKITRKNIAFRSATVQDRFDQIEISSWRNFYIFNRHIRCPLPKK